MLLKPEVLEMRGGQPKAGSVVFFPAASGNPAYLSPLMRAIPPALLVAGLRYPYCAAEASVEEVARSYVDALLDHAVEPKALVGWCVGGLFAVEAAAELQRRAKPVEAVILVDTHVPEASPDGVSRDDLALANLRQFAGDEIAFPAEVSDWPDPWVEVASRLFPPRSARLNAEHMRRTSYACADSVLAGQRYWPNNDKLSLLPLTYIWGRDGEPRVSQRWWGQRAGDTSCTHYYVDARHDELLASSSLHWICVEIFRAHIRR